MRSKTPHEFADDMARGWDNEAHQLDRSAPNAPTSFERRLIEMHARVKRACAQELRLAAARMPRG